MPMRALRVFAAAVMLGATSMFTLGAEPPATPTPPKPPPLGTITVDVVELIDTGKGADGVEANVVEHGNYRYLFASAKSKEAFSANPVKYEVQQGGACGRMGPLSGACRSDIYSVHQGKLYLFASEVCRETFTKAPEKCIESDEAPPAADASALSEGGALVGKCVEWMGGAARVDSLKSIEMRREKTRDYQGKPTREAAGVTLLFTAGAVRRDYTWDRSMTSDILGPGGAYSSAPDCAYRPLHSAQARALERLRDGNVLSMLRSRGKPGFAAAALPAREGEDFRRVVCSLGGVNTTLLIAPGDGALRGMAYRGRGERALIGTIERRYTAFATVGGIKLPTAWSGTFEGAPGEVLNASDVIWQVDMADEAMFAYKPVP